MSPFKRMTPEERCGEECWAILAAAATAKRMLDPDIFKGDNAKYRTDKQKWLEYLGWFEADLVWRINLLGDSE